MKMAHVQIRDGVVDWYWTADFMCKLQCEGKRPDLRATIGSGATFGDLARKWTFFKGLGVRFRNLFWSLIVKLAHHVASGGDIPY